MKTLEIVDVTIGHVYWAGNDFREMLNRLADIPPCDALKIRIHADGFVTDLDWGHFHQHGNYLG